MFPIMRPRADRPSDPVANPLPLDLDPDQSTKVFLMVRTMHWLTLQNHQAQKRVGTVG
jgi:hypothetical protein